MFSCSRAPASSDFATKSFASVSIFAAMGLEDFFGRPRGFFTVCSSEIAISSVSNFFTVAFFFDDCLFLVEERLDLGFEFSFSSAAGLSSSSTFVTSVAENCSLPNSSVISFSSNKSFSRSSSDSSSSSFLRNASENARSSSIRASRSATGI